MLQGCNHSIDAPRSTPDIYPSQTDLGLPVGLKNKTA